jgi:hypothetical protein
MFFGSTVSLFVVGVGVADAINTNLLIQFSFVLKSFSPIQFFEIDYLNVLRDRNPTYRKPHGV